MLSLLSYGEVLVDLLPDESEFSRYSPLAGGAPANVAVAYAKLGGSSYFSGGISQDSFGTMLYQELVQNGVNVNYVNDVEQANTALVLVNLDENGERTFNFYRHETADMQYPISQIKNIAWQEIDIFHYCSNTLTNESMYNSTLYALESAKIDKVLISFDVNLRQQLWQDLTLLPSHVEACIKVSDIIKLSLEEARYLAKFKQLNVDDYVDYLMSLDVTLIVITDGPNAVRLVSTNYTLFTDVPKINAIDTTAAGDSFIAGFLYFLSQYASDNNECLPSIIKDEKLISVASMFAGKCSAYTCQKKGAFAALPKITDI